MTFVFGAQRGRSKTKGARGKTFGASGGLQCAGHKRGDIEKHNRVTVMILLFTHTHILVRQHPTTTHDTHTHPYTLCSSTIAHLLYMNWEIHLSQFCPHTTKKLCAYVKIRNIIRDNTATHFLFPCDLQIWRKQRDMQLELCLCCVLRQCK